MQSFAPTPYDVPPFLQSLIPIDQLLVKEKVEFFQTYYRYNIKNRQGENVFYAIEDGDCCNRMCRPSMSSMSILDNRENEIIHLRREWTCEPVNCFPFCCAGLEKLEVLSPPGSIIGLIEEVYSWRDSKFDIKNENGDVVLKIYGPSVGFSCCGENVDFRILSADGSIVVGKISKQWSGIFSTASYFGVAFPLDLDVRMKAVLLGACFLIDYIFYKSRTND